MWTPPDDEKVQESGWQPPSDERVQDAPTKNPSLIGKAWDALAVPEQMSKQGLGQLAEMVPKPEPTGNLPMDLIKGAPRIAAESVGEAAPGFVSRGSILTAGASKALGVATPLVKAVGRGLGTQMESLTGAVPGSLRAAYNDAKLMLAPGKSAAKPLYEAAKDELPEGANVFKGMYKPEQIVDTAKDYLGKGGKLEPAEALIYRKAIDSLSKSGRYVKDELFAMRGEADAMAKESDAIASGDKMYQRGRFADSLRNILPQNKYGGTSAFKIGIMAALEQMGIPGKIALAAMSPAAAGVVSTGAGITARAVGPIVTNPQAAVAIPQAISTIKDKEDLYREYINRKSKRK